MTHEMQIKTIYKYILFDSIMLFIYEDQSISYDNDPLA